MIKFWKDEFCTFIMLSQRKSVIVRISSVISELDFIILGKDEYLAKSKNDYGVSFINCKKYLKKIPNTKMRIENFRIDKYNLHFINHGKCSFYPTKNVNTIIKYYKNGYLHRDGDFPAVFGKNVSIYYKKGILHRDGDLPSYVNGEISVYHKKGVLHREGGNPAYIDHFSGEKRYYIDGNLVACILDL